MAKKGRRNNPHIAVRYASDGREEGYDTRTGQVLWVSETKEEYEARIAEEKAASRAKQSESMKQMYAEKKLNQQGPDETTPSELITTKYTDEKANYICDQLAKGKSLRSICANRDDLPTPQAVSNWVRRKPEFNRMYREARVAKSYYHIDQVADIAESLQDKDEVPVAKEKINAHKWLASTLNPEEFSGKTEADKKGSSGPVTININTGIQKDEPGAIEADFEVKDDE